MESSEFIYKEMVPQNGEPARNPEVSLEQEKPPENFTEFRQEEDKVVDGFFKKTGKALSRAALSLSLFMGASSAYGKDIEGGGKAEPTIMQKAEDGPTSTIEKLMSRMSITLGGTREAQAPFTGETFNEVYNYKPLTETNFYNKLTQEQFKEVGESYYSAIAAKDADAYFNALRGLTERADKTPLNGMQKTLFLQRLGAEAYFRYNADMLAKGEHIKISADDMLDALKSEDGKDGTCANISTFVAKSARSLGYDAWVQSTMIKNGGHAVTGLVLDSGNFAFLDGGRIVDTGTKDYQKAQGILEKVNKRIPIWSYAQLADGKIVETDSNAGLITKKYAGIRMAQNELDAMLGAGAVRENLGGVDVVIGPEEKTLTLTDNHVSLALSNYENTPVGGVADPYQSIHSLNSVRLGTNFAGEHLGLDMNASYMHFSLDDMQKGKVNNYDAAILQMFGSYLGKKHELTKGELGTLSAQLGATIQAAINIPFGNEDKSQPLFSRVSVMGEAAVGGRMIYIDPSEANTFYIGASMRADEKVSDAERQRPGFVNASTRIGVGGEIRAYKGVVLGFDASKTKEVWGSSTAAKLNIKTPTTGFEIIEEDSKSNEKQIIPSTTKTSATLSYKWSPKYEVRASGFKEKKQYAGQTTNDTGATVTLVMRFF